MEQDFESALDRLLNVSVTADVGQTLALSLQEEIDALTQLQNETDDRLDGAISNTLSTELSTNNRIRLVFRFCVFWFCFWF